MLSALIAGITHLRKIWRIAGRLQCLRIHMGVRLQLRAQDTMSSRPWPTWLGFDTRSGGTGIGLKNLRAQEAFPRSCRMTSCVAAEAAPTGCFSAVRHAAS
ncbi:hypothetical protein [Xanthomonas sp. CFBP 8445]|uniref:hypothetical protein n=1 Tax=Xanthomonas sp. CFBP 8445 TaxID=2971236 RepID=UPI0021DFADDD|nr:hypothetical protein [Xanthomonas sp. CFBP 8445]UYC11686.1 hypothetical protein NUG21_18350 [Xanthomonas sp. CFBP 8445]